MKGNRKMNEAVQVSMFMDRQLIAQLDRKAKMLSKKTGFHVSRSDLVRQVLDNYVAVSV